MCELQKAEDFDESLFVKKIEREERRKHEKSKRYLIMQNS